LWGILGVKLIQNFDCLGKILTLWFSSHNYGQHLIRRHVNYDDSGPVSYLINKKKWMNFRSKKCLYTLGVSKKTDKSIKPRKPEKNNRKNRIEKKNRINRLKNHKKIPVRFGFGFGFYSLKQIEPNRTEPVQSTSI